MGNAVSGAFSAARVPATSVPSGPLSSPFSTAVPVASAIEEAAVEPSDEPSSSQATDSETPADETQTAAPEEVADPAEQSGNSQAIDEEVADPGAEQEEAVEEHEEVTDTNGDGKINLMDTITETEGEISLIQLTAEEYHAATKADLNAFLKRVAPSLPEEAQAQIASINKKTTQAHLADMAVSFLIA